MKKTVLTLVLVLLALTTMSGCGVSDTRPDTGLQTNTSEAALAAVDTEPEKNTEEPSEELPEQPKEEPSEGPTEEPAEAADVTWENLSFDRQMELLAANQFSVSYSPEGYKKIHIESGQEFLVVPSGLPEPSGVPEDFIVLRQPLNQIYLVATGAMDFFRQLGSIDVITLSSQKRNNWYIKEAQEAMDAGRMLYAGKYSTPDYELILSAGCDLAIQNTMIYHTPEVLEQLAKLGIPALVDMSSYETDPLGRMEWLKLYAALVDKEEDAMAYFEELMEELQGVINREATGKTVAFFSVNTNGAVTVRKSADYIAKSIALAGGTYISFDETEEENALSTMTIQMESFYASARDADVLIYNSTIEGEVDTVEQLLQKSYLLEDFRAVQEGNVWCIEKNFYQESLELGKLIMDINKILNDDEVQESDLYFLHRVNK